MGNLIRECFFEGEVKGNPSLGYFLRVRQGGILLWDIFSRISRRGFLFGDTFLREIQGGIFFGDNFSRTGKRGILLWGVFLREIQG